MAGHSGSAGAAAGSRRLYRLLLLLPFVWQVGMAGVVNDVRATVLGIPFPMLWQMLGVVFTSVVIGLVYVLDRGQRPADGAGDGDR